VNTTADEPLKLKRAVSASDLSSAVREYTIPSRASADGISVPVSPVVLVDPSSDPHRLVPQGWWLYQARRINASGGAGALVIRIQMNPGQVGRIVGMFTQGPASAGATLYCVVVDEDGANVSQLVAIAAGASRSAYLPSIGTAATANANTANSHDYMLGPGEYLTITGSTSLITETLTVGIKLLLSTPEIPLWDITGSVGGSALGDSTISPENTLQKVDLPW